MEHADGGDIKARMLAQKGRPFPETQVLDWFVQTCLAIKHMHDRKVLHRDIKAANIFLTSAGRVKLGDFGISKTLTETKAAANTVIGTPYYLSPEMVNSKPYGYKSDVWALGVLLYEMCTFKPPFDAKSLHALGMKIVSGKYAPIGGSYSNDMRQLVARLLQVDQNKRPEIREILKYPYVSSRIRTLLTETVRLDEFSHTVLHNESLFEAAARQKREEEEKKEEEEKQRFEETERKKKAESDDAERRRLIMEIRERRRNLRAQQMNSEVEEQVMAYDMQEAMLANEAEEDTPTPQFGEDDERPDDPIIEDPSNPIQTQKDSIVAMIGQACFNEAYSVVKQIGLDIIDVTQYFVYFDHVIDRDMQEDILPRLWAIAQLESS